MRRPGSANLVRRLCFALRYADPMPWEQRAAKLERERRRLKKHGRTLLTAKETPLKKRLGRRLKRKSRR